MYIYIYVCVCMYIYIKANLSICKYFSYTCSQHKKSKTSINLELENLVSQVIINFNNRVNSRVKKFMKKLEEGVIS